MKIMCEICWLNSFASMGAPELLDASAFSQGQRFAAIHKGDVLAALRRATGKDGSLSVVVVPGATRNAQPLGSLQPRPW